MCIILEISGFLLVLVVVSVYLVIYPIYLLSLVGHVTHSFSFNFWLRWDIRSGKNEGYISARITLNGKRAEIATGYKIGADRWNVAAGSVKGNKEDARTINVQLTAIKNRLNEIFLDLRQNQADILTVELIRNTCLGKIIKKMGGFIFRESDQRIARATGRTVR